MRATTKERVYQVANEVLALVEAEIPNVFPEFKLAEVEVMFGKMYGTLEPEKDVEGFEEWVEEIYCKKYPNCK